MKTDVKVPRCETLFVHLDYLTSLLPCNVYVCVHVRACASKAGLTVCCRAAIGQRAQINNHAVQADVELASRHNRSFVLRLQHQTQLHVLH